ncbi:hypothetical protein HMPREF9318_01160 [Streptococcus urinalis FB127-CNA-2]|uniref:Endolytic murein transglycosylase n=1 Tax=Streptococcus urinalis 2285-97 TaxID=764291 RepID=G5KI34_9STRE|nr:endolytic transglycosylase MltG [Streptococcus urinalis]EHJ55639.1 YceG family protein [Streptococcus urinalis 2285-97]EKS20522.1 hypothetical protein HMPREF9318_01160 [Streptococcus urinalis FB127-CNA-2]VEF31215.1 YceG-like family membrane protein [Streptococcus urinalis]
MTDLKDQESKSQGGRSFKEQILAELEEANRLRKIREEELFQKEQEAKELAQKTAQLMAEYEEQDRKDRAEADLQAQKKKLHDNAQKALQENHIAVETDQESIDQTLNQISDTFSPKERKENKTESLEEDNPTSELSTKQSEEIFSESQDFSSNNDSSLSQKESNSASMMESTEFDQTKPLPVVSMKSEDDSMMSSSEETNLIGNSDSESQFSEGDKTSSELDSETPSVESTLAPVNSNQPIETSSDVKEDTEKSMRKKRRQKTEGLANKITKRIILVLVLILIALGLFGAYYINSSLKPVDKTDKSYVQVDIPIGSGNKLIGQILEKDGLIKSGTVFNFYSKFKNYTNFQSGYYNLQKSMSLDEIAKELQKGGTTEPTKPAVGKVLVREGYTIKQIADSIDDNVATKSTKDKTPFTSKAFLAVVKDKTFIADMVKKYSKLLGNLPSSDEATYQLEGYLFPATYNYYKDTDMKALVEEMISTTNQTLSPYYDKIASSGKTVNEVLTMASLVEKEGSTDEDRRKIASVFNNRLDSGMALQSNIAVLYAIGKLGEKTTLSEDASINTSINSPYNDYTNTGLMPGPVDSPSKSAIEATVNPDSTDYLYFVADVKTGNVYYAKTYEEHTANVEKYVNSNISQ